VSIVAGLVAIISRNDTTRFDVLGGAAIIGGLAMIVVAVTRPGG
jgi:hypothetical protein